MRCLPVSVQTTEKTNDTIQEMFKLPKEELCFFLFFFFFKSQHKLQSAGKHLQHSHLTSVWAALHPCNNPKPWLLKWATCLFWTVTSTGCSSAIFMRGQHQNILKCHVAHSQTGESIHILLTLSFYRPTINTIPLQHLPVHWWELSLRLLDDSHFIFWKSIYNKY